MTSCLEKESKKEYAHWRNSFWNGRHIIFHDLDDGSLHGWEEGQRGGRSLREERKQNGERIDYHARKLRVRRGPREELNHCAAKTPDI